MPNASELIGFDVSDAHFPASSSLGENTKLIVADAKKPSAEEHHRKFDLVHIGLLVCAMDGDDWPRVTQNAKQLLKPGGAT